MIAQPPVINVLQLDGHLKFKRQQLNDGIASLEHSGQTPNVGYLVDDTNYLDTNYTNRQSVYLHSL